MEGAADTFQVYWVGSVLLAGLTFAAGWALRHRQLPSWLTALGKISFSLYLLHSVLLMLNDQFLGTPDHDDVVRLGIFVVALVAVSALTYRYVEVPFQRLGRRLNQHPVTPGRPAAIAAPTRVPDRQTPVPEAVPSQGPSI